MSKLIDIVLVSLGIISALLFLAAIVAMVWVICLSLGA